MNKFFLTFMVMGAVICAKAQNSSDYYKTGDLISLHRHTAGNGIAVVFIGDGFDKEDCRKGGVYEDNCLKLSKLFLSMPVIREFKDCFDVLARVDVSNERGVYNCVDNVYGTGGDIKWDKIRSNATLAAGRDDRSVIFVGNGLIGGYAMGDVAVYSANEGYKLYWMMHEFVGHIIGRMPDMYVEDGEGHVNASTKATIDSQHLVGELSMLDWRSQPDSVFWKDFIGRKGYENVGVYPSGWYGIVFGELFTCEPHNSTVMCSHAAAYFTVMERYQLWRQIQARAGFPTTLDRFVEYDAVNLKDTDRSWKRYSSLDWTDERIWNGKCD
jgi:hypothetical protein